MAVAAHNAAQQVLDALGITMPVRKLVIEFDVDSAVMVYVVGFASRDAIDTLAKVLSGPVEVKVVHCEDVVVDHHADVVAMPSDNPLYPK